MQRQHRPQAQFFVLCMCSCLFCAPYSKITVSRALQEGTCFLDSSDIRKDEASEQFRDIVDAEEPCGYRFSRCGVSESPVERL